MYKYILLLHVLAATVWVGGHLVLALTVLPRALRERSPAELLRFEGGYEKIGMPALLIQVASGLWLAHALVPDFRAWFAGGVPFAHLILLKLSLLAATLLLAADARLRIIPRLSPETLPVLARRIVLVTFISVLFVVTGVAFRTGSLL